MLGGGVQSTCKDVSRMLSKERLPTASGTERTITGVK